MKRILSVLFLAVMALTASAETHYKPHISIGARGGVTLGRMSFSPSVRQGWVMGSTGAVTFRYTEEKLFGLIAEFGWVQRGWAEGYKNDVEKLPFKYSRSLTYISLPILTHIYFGSRRFKTFVNLGPQFNFLIGSSISSNFDYHNIASVPDYPRNRMTDQLTMDIKNRFDYGICASLGFEFYASPRNSIVAEGRFYYGLGNIFPSSKADVFSASRNMSIEISLGYNFRLK